MNTPYEELQERLKSRPRFWVVTGAGGFIGSHLVEALLRLNQRVAGLDNLSTGFRGAVLHGAFVEGDTGDAALVARVLAEHGVDTVMHFAAHIQVPESVANPLKYYRNNTANTRTLLECCVAAGAARSAAATNADRGTGRQRQREAAIAAAAADRLDYDAG